MSERVERAKELFFEGYNCSQAVVGAFCEDLGVSFELGMRLSSSFGAGMGRLREVCGTVSGVFILAGIKYGYSDMTDKEAKARHYKLVQAIAERFREEKGSIICRELLQKRADERESYIPDERTSEYYKKRPCVAMVEAAARIAEEVLDGRISDKEV